jgi:hypothetical protein
MRLSGLAECCDLVGHHRGPVARVAEPSGPTLPGHKIVDRAIIRCPLSPTCGSPGRRRCPGATVAHPDRCGPSRPCAVTDRAAEVVTPALQRPVAADGIGHRPGASEDGPPRHRCGRAGGRDGEYREAWRAPRRPRLAGGAGLASMIPSGVSWHGYDPAGHHRPAQLPAAAPAPAPQAVIGADTAGVPFAGTHREPRRRARADRGAVVGGCAVA